MMTAGRAKLAITAVCALVVGLALFNAGLRLPGSELKTFGTIPAFKATMVDGGEVAEIDGSAFAGKVWLADFIFTSCAGPCPILSEGMARLQKSLPPEVELVSFTVDPVHDTPEVLGRYGARFGAEPGRWVFLRLGTHELYELLYAGFRLPVLNNPKEKPGYRVTHTTKMVLVDRSGAVRGYYDGTDPASLKLIERDAGKLLKGRS